LFFVGEDAEELFQKRAVCLKVLDDVDLVEKYEGVENAECGVIEDTRKNNVLEVL
jgi:hypothetical protein